MRILFGTGDTLTGRITGKFPAIDEYIIGRTGGVKLLP